MLGSLVLLAQDSLAVRQPEELPGLPVELPDELFLIRSRVGCRGGKNRHRNKEEAGEQEGGQENVWPCSG